MFASMYVGASPGLTGSIRLYRISIASRQYPSASCVYSVRRLRSASPGAIATVLAAICGGTSFGGSVGVQNDEFYCRDLFSLTYKFNKNLLEEILYIFRLLKYL